MEKKIKIPINDSESTDNMKQRISKSGPRPNQL